MYHVPMPLEHCRRTWETLVSADLNGITICMYFCVHFCTHTCIISNIYIYIYIEMKIVLSDSYTWVWKCLGPTKLKVRGEPQILAQHSEIRPRCTRESTATEWRPHNLDVQAQFCHAFLGEYPPVRHNYGKSQFFMGKSTINGNFQ